MKLAKIRLADGTVRIAALADDERSLRLLDLSQVQKIQTLTDILHAPEPLGLARFLLDPKSEPMPLSKATLLAPIDQQEVWAAGVTYKRSQVARMEESETGATHYDKVYTADRPELFFKATAGRVSGPGEPVRVRLDSRWSVPEPELALVISDKRLADGFHRRERHVGPRYRRRKSALFAAGQAVSPIVRAWTVDPHSGSAA
jgi:2-dehydro-3-deoxy-D-arabinonate dehydratase